MKVSDAELQEFIAIHQEEFGETLSLAEASEMAFRLVGLYTQLTKALPSEQRKTSDGEASSSRNFATVAHSHSVHKNIQLD
jgi:hypothetical protein